MLKTSPQLIDISHRRWIRPVVKVQY